MTGTPYRVYLSGANAKFFQVTQQPASSVGPGGATGFKIKTVQDTPPPVPDGWEKDISFDINIDNNDADEDPYNFTIKMKVKK